MTDSFLARLQEATRLVRLGRTSGATRLIRSNLMGETPAPTAPAGRPRRPLPEVIGLLKGGRTAADSFLHPSRQRREISEPIPAGASFLSSSFACEAGERNYKLYVPSGGNDQPRPLVVMLHGCTQDPDDFAAGTGMNRLAEELDFLVAYPEQTALSNQLKCWNWFNPRDQVRDHGEPAIIAGIAREIATARNIDRSRICIIGLSAGGAMAAVLGKTHPDVFAGIGVHSGLPYGAASDVPSAFAAMRNQRVNGTLMNPRSRSPDAIDAAPRTIVFHGGADTTVHPENGARLFADACARSHVDIDTQDGIATGGRHYSVSRAISPGGETVAEHWLVHGAGHAWSGGRAAGSYTDPRGPDASREMLRFLLCSGR